MNITIGISFGTKFLLKLAILIFGSNLLKKNISRLKHKSRSFCVRLWLLLTKLNFSAQNPTDTAVFWPIWSQCTPSVPPEKFVAFCLWKIRPCHVTYLLPFCRCVLSSVCSVWSFFQGSLPLRSHASVYM